MTTAQLRTALARLPDRPTPTDASSEAGLRPAAAAPPPPVGGLPWRYGVTELVAMPVDPVLVHVYWELTPQTVASIRAQLGPAWEGASQVLRAYDVSGISSDDGDASLVARARHRFDLDVGGEVGSYYVHLWSPEQTLIFEIGWRTRDGRFAAAARSNRVSTPRNAPCEGGGERWMTVREGRIVATPPEAIPRDAATAGGPDGRSETAPWSATFPAHRGWGGHP